MKSMLFLAAMIAIPTLAQAGDNGAYTKCVSGSGRTVLTMGTVGSANAPSTVELKIDGKTLGQAEIENEVLLHTRERGNLLMFTEADHDQVDWVTVRLSPDIDGRGRQKAQILSGLDPRTLTPLDSKINLVCKVVYNPI